MRRLLCLLCLLVCAGSSKAGLLVNEALVNEPGTDVTLEWIEIYNDSSDYVDLGSFILVINGNSINFIEYGFLAPHKYMIVCRNLIGTGTSPGFETVWGNNSGLWGDTPEESALRVAEESFTLPNSSGYIRIYSFTSLVSELTWSDVGADGYSWERVSPTDNAGVNSTDPSGSTPGRVNSISPAALDLELRSVWHTSSIGGSSFRVELFNRGTDIARSQSLLVYRRQPLDSTDSHDTLFTAPIEPLAPGKRDTLEFSFAEPTIYTHLGLLLSQDERPANNRGFVTVTGSLYPPVILSEFLPDPALPLTSEWIELQNISDSTISLAGWRIGDELTIRTISSLFNPLLPGERIVLVQDSTSFRQFYDESTTRLIQTAGWPSLNNNGDLVRLIDTFSFTADRVQYEAGYGDNFTHARDQATESDGPWKKSAEPGGTPGTLNTIWDLPISDRTRVIIMPQIFSPDGDGADDVTTIQLTAATASAYTLRIYDRTGNIVKTFLDDEPLTTGTLTWDGRSNAGNRLPIGIYICYFEAEGVESVKETVVIAR